ncbi:MAG: hypothetical protein KDA28_11940 [Phycisphaerales bacterium]|nr:hypothetical protein [Phycisphaerales bacterium]
MWALVALPLVASITIWWIGRRGVLRVSGPDPFCARCRYPAEAEVCPECGRDLTTPGAIMTRSTRRRRLAFLLVVLLMGLLDFGLSVAMSMHHDRTVPGAVGRWRTQRTTTLHQHWEFQLTRVETGGFQCEYLDGFENFQSFDDDVIYGVTVQDVRRGVMMPSVRTSGFIVSCGDRTDETDAILLEMVEADMPPNEARLIRAGIEGRAIIEPIWSGIVHDVLMVAALGLAAWTVTTWDRPVSGATQG